MNERIAEFSRNLIGVNNEKEPLSGTTPESWLFDKSLNLMNKTRSMLVSTAYK
jgi:hypothetical protein